MNHEEVECEDYGIGGSSGSSEVNFEFSDSSVKQSAKHINEKSKRSQQFLLIKILIIKVKAKSLATAVSLKHL